MALDPILRTKLYIPPLRTEFIPRPHLVEQINSGIKGKLVFVYAPAGYGKTTLLAEWAGQSNLPIAWLSLDCTDRDPITFYHYLIASLQTIFPGLGDGILLSLRSITTHPIKTLVASLINEIFEQAHDFTLVLDDFHRLVNLEVIQILDSLICDLPPQMHVIIASRSDLPFPYARMRLQGEVTTIGIDDLRFKPLEVTAYLHNQLGGRLNATEEDILIDRSEGWIAGLQMAVLSLQSSRDPHKDISVFSGQNRYVADYLIDEVLSRQNPETYQFLIQTSILDKFTAELCNQVTGLGNGHAVLEYLDRSGLFVIPLDDTRTWYRYHHLFAELLNNRLRKQQPGIIVRLHINAAEWFADHQYFDEAIEHWLTAEDYESAVGYIQDKLDNILAKGKFATFLNWLDRIPNVYLVNKPKLILYQLFQLWEMGYVEKYHHQKQLVEKMMGPTPETAAGLDAETAGCQGIFAVLKCMENAAVYNIDRISDYVDRLFLLIPEDLPFWRVMANGTAGFCNRVNDHFPEALDYFSNAIDLASKSRFLFPYFMYTAAQSRIYLDIGRISNAIETCQLPLILEAQQNYSIPFSGLSHAVMGELLYLSGDLAAAKENIVRGIELITNDGEGYSMANAYLTLAQINAAQNDRDGAIDAMALMMRRLGELKSPAPAVIIGKAYQAYIWTMCGRIQQAAAWVENSGVDRLDRSEFPKVIGSTHFGIYCTIHQSINYYYYFIQMIIARVEMATGNARVALDRINTVVDKIDNEIKSSLFKTQTYILQALALSRMSMDGQDSAIVAAIQPFLDEPCYQVFVREGQPMRSVLVAVKDSLQNHAVSADNSIRVVKFIDEVLARINANSTSVEKNQESWATPSGLTHQENIVLEHLSQGIGYEEIAHILLVSPNTIKTHINRIYKKMGVTNRLQAVNKAREMGWIA